jgi:DNA invertase Pin-like site-specific DNA recombinase
MKYGYARCSTNEHKQDLERQARELVTKGAEKIFKEYASGMTLNRKEYTKLINRLQEGDTLAVTEISRLSRSLHDLLHVAEDAKSRRIRLECGILELDYTAEVDPMHQAMFQLMGVFGELERGLTVQRIKSGLKNAKEKGSIMGRPKKTIDDVPKTVLDLLPRFQSGEFSKKRYAELAGVTRPTLYKCLRLLGVEIKTDAKHTVADIPAIVLDLYPAFQAGEISKTDYARKAGIGRNTLYKYLRLLQG